VNDYLYVVTLQGNGKTITFKGIHKQQPGETREQAFDSVLAWAMQQSGITNPTVLFFSLEPNILGGAR
jgi:hypothetical protein